MASASAKDRITRFSCRNKVEVEASVTRYCNARRHMNQFFRSTGLLGEKSCIQAIGMLLVDLTSRAPTAISATISLDVRPFNAALGSGHTSQTNVWGLQMCVRRIDQDAPSPINPLRASATLT
jgi:hypothetical protein